MTRTATMRDAFIEGLYDRMTKHRELFFLSADFGAPKLDSFRKEFSDRFINVGIAEQNLINVGAGIALEGFSVYAYGIAPFLTMRAYEQIRNNLALMAQLRDVNVNLIGVGAGLSYDVSGPTHHCLEDIGLLRLLPNITVISPCDWVVTTKLIDYTITNRKPKYLRFDGKSLPALYDPAAEIPVTDGFCELRQGRDICIVSTGYMTHKALRVRDILDKDGIDAGVIDVFILKPCNEDALFNALARYRSLLTLEEGFIHKGGLDSLVAGLLNDRGAPIPMSSMGFRDKYVFEIGDREYLYSLNGLDDQSVCKRIQLFAGGAVR